MLKGTITNGNTIVPIYYPNWTIFEAQVDTGAQMLDTAMHSTSGPMVVMGHSLGAVVACNWLANYGPTSTIEPSDVSFVLLGNSVRKYGGFCNTIHWYPDSIMPDGTPYTVTDFVRQYDGWGDYPSNILNFEALMNAQSGMNVVHPNYTTVTLNDATNYSYTPYVGSKPGNITYVWSMTVPLPILGVTPSTLIDDLDADLRPGIEAGYSRPLVIPSPWLPAVAPPPPPPSTSTGNGQSVQYGSRMVDTAVSRGHVSSFMVRQSSVRS